MWFTGLVVDAVAKAKKENTLLIVFVYGKDEKSVETLHCWEDDVVKSFCVENGFVALKFDKDTIEARQFAEFYPLVSIPISFLIGGDGIPIDVLIDSTTTAKLKEKVLSAYEKLQSKRLNKPDTENASKTDVQHVDNAAKAEALIKQIQMKKEEAAKNDEREREIRRREEGKSMLDAKEKQKELEILAAVKERKQDKIADREHLKQIREQIAADRNEKMKKFREVRQSEDEEKKHKAEAAQKATAERLQAQEQQLHKNARIQFRFADGTSFAEQFDADRPLSDAYNFVSKNASMRHGDFQLIQMYPRQEFTQSDANKSFKELNLAPSSVIMVMEAAKRRNRSALQKYQGSWMWSFFTFILSPVIPVYNWFYALVFPPQNQSSSKSTIQPGSSSNTSGQQRSPSDGQQPTKHSNIRLLNDRERSSRKDDDDNATWNGNSTQQL